MSHTRFMFCLVVGAIVAAVVQVIAFKETGMAAPETAAAQTKTPAYQAGASVNTRGIDMNERSVKQVTGGAQ